MEIDLGGDKNSIIEISKAIIDILKAVFYNFIHVSCNIGIN